jgi:uncharacterized protein
LTGDRDRDATGRARNARPRDALGRPLPRDAVGVQPVPDDLDLGPDETLAEAQRLLDEGRAFAAHEVLEARWKAAPDGQRDFWQGLAQLAVGLTHVQRGNLQGAAALLSRGSDRVASYAGRPDAQTYGVDVDGVLAWAGILRGALEGGDESPPTTPPRLRAR